MIKFGTIKAGEHSDNLKKIYGSVVLQGDGWFIEVQPSLDMRRLNIRCAGSVSGDSELIIHPQSGNEVSVYSKASERQA